jgi:uridine kinase
MNPRSPLIIGIAGGSGSGKTSVTERILERLEDRRATVILHDSYYRDIREYGGLAPSEVNFDHPDALETSLLVRHLEDLRAGRAVAIPSYDYTTHTRAADTRRVESAEIIIVDGILIFADPALRGLMDIRIFVDTDADERLIRRIRRDTRERGRSLDSVLDQYLKTVRPMHLQFVEPSKHWADIIIPRGGENSVAIEMVASRILEMLRTRGG